MSYRKDHYFIAMVIVQSCPQDSFLCDGQSYGMLTLSASLIFFIRQRRHFDETTGKRMEQLNPR
ncbi:hypothetical protein, partial [Peribacillus aracenensis]|uniref:hypothetical protein n=1 Tax=Peribacillus aracenensis TaxID=2976708 RepID=UPI0021A35CCF